MRIKSIVTVIVMTSVTITGAALLSAGSAQAATKVKTFKNCTEMHKTYKGGVAKVHAFNKDSKGRRAKSKYAPKVSTALYNANKKSDRDKDGVACEQ